MANEIVVFVRASENHWFDLSSPEEPTIRQIPWPSDRAKGVVEVDSTTLGEAVEGLREARRALVFYDGNSVLAIQKLSTSWLGRGASPSEEVFRWVAMSRAWRFRSDTKDRLITALSSEIGKSSTEEVLEAFRQYTFFDGFSCWLYNRETKCFTRIASDGGSDVDVLTDVEVPAFSNAIQTSKVLDADCSEGKGIPDFETHGSASVQVFSTSTLASSANPDQFTAVVCMFTKHSGYRLRPKTVKLIRESLSQSLAQRYFNRIIHLNEIRASVRAMREIDNLGIVIEAICKLTANQSGWETCSVYLHQLRGGDMGLYRAASYPTDDPNSASMLVVYDPNSASLTADVFRSRQPRWSYDIANDPRNSHTYDDRTSGSGKNWIGVPIIARNSEVLGVLRVKNRLVSDEAIHENFSALDLYNLQAVAYDLASIIDQYNRYAERKESLEQRAKEVQELTDFLRTFTHEIRSPVQAVCFAPDRLRLILRDTELIESFDLLPPKLRDYLADLKAIGARLEMLSKALTLDPEDIVRDISRCVLYKDCIAPVLAFAEAHARKRGRRIWYSKDSLAVGLQCDATAISIAFHVLMDNAVKYSDRDNLVRIYGQRVDRDRFRICVESSSDVFSISECESKEIFQKYKRGAAANQQKMEGSGIGLFLASRIAELHGGKVVLVQRIKPITFALELPI